MGISPTGMLKPGIEQQLFPFEHRQVVSVVSRDRIQMRVDGVDARGDGQMELIKVHVVAAPGERLSICREDNAGDIRDGAAGCVMAGDPFGRGEHQGSGGDGNIDFGVQQFTRRFGVRSALIRIGFVWAMAEGARRSNESKWVRENIRVRCSVTKIVYGVLQPGEML